MRKVVLVLVVLACLAVTGCAQKQITWHHPSKDQADFTKDEYDCQYEATKATAYYAHDVVAQFEQAQQKRNIYIMCMRNKGYQDTALPQDIRQKNREIPQNSPWRQHSNYIQQNLDGPSLDDGHNQ